MFSGRKRSQNSMLASEKSDKQSWGREMGKVSKWKKVCINYLSVVCSNGVMQCSDEKCSR